MKEDFKSLLLFDIVERLNNEGYKVHFCSDRKTNREFVRTSMDSVYYVISYPEVIFYIINKSLYIGRLGDIRNSDIDMYDNFICGGTEVELPTKSELYDPNCDVDALADKIVKEIKSFGKVPFSCHHQWWK